MLSPEPLLAKASQSIAKPPPGVAQGVALPGSQEPGYSPVYRNWRVGEGPIPSTIDPQITTMFEAFESACKKYPDNKCLGWREKDKAKGVWSPYKWMDYKTVQQRRTNFGAGLVHLHAEHGVTATKYPIGLWSQNRPEWQITDLACMSQSLFSVSIYDTLGPESAEYIINHAELACVVATLEHIPTLLTMKDKLPCLKMIVSINPLEEGEAPGQTKRALLSAWASEKGVALYSMTDVERLGQQHPRPLVPPSPDDPITINYTSGTTGFPKGVLLTHANCIAGASCAMSSNMYQTCYDVLLSYLPLAHIYARVTENTALWGGGGIGYFHGEMTEVLDDIKALRPTTFISVPRLYNRISSAIKENTVEQNGLKGALSRHALSAKLENMKATGSNKHAFYDRIWANKVKAALGFDRCRGMVSGSAPIAPEVLEHLRCVFSNDFIEGYGMTETYAVAMGQLQQDNSSGNVGPPSIAVECRLRDVVEMGYTSADKPHARGELLVRGHTIFKGYYKAPELNSQVFDKDGWFATGDICRVDELGRFSIIDRVKNLLKLAQGEYVSPEKIENQYLANLPILAQGLVHGDSFQTYLVGIFGVDRPHFATFASQVLKKTIDPTNDQAILSACESKEIKRALLKEMDKVAKKGKLLGFEKVKNVHLCLDPFTLENDLLTPTLKMKRAPAIKKFKDILDKLYEEVEKDAPQKAKL